MDKRRLSLVVVMTLAFAAAALLPFMGLERFEGDQTALLLSIGCAAVGTGAVVRRLRPHYTEAYVSGASMVFVILCLLGLVGMLSGMGSGSFDLGLIAPGAGR